MNTRQVDLHERRHTKCLKCGRQDRKEFSGAGICEKIVSEDDQLSVRCVGDWAYDKIFHLYQYFGIFTNGMKNSWRGLNYVEICSGPGRCIFKETGEEVDGTAIAVLRHKSFVHLKSALFIDCDAAVVNALNRRIAALGLGHKAVAEVGNYTDSLGIVNLMKRLSPRHLNLVFIDPTECDVPFETITAIIKGLKNVDLIINLPSYMDAGRNLANAVTDPSYKRARGKYAGFLGSAEFFEDAGMRALALAGHHRDLRLAFRDFYQKQMAKLGHVYWATREIRGLYDLVFASSDPKGLEFWNKACKYEANGQGSLDLWSS